MEHFPLKKNPVYDAIVRELDNSGIRHTRSQRGKHEAVEFDIGGVHQTIIMAASPSDCARRARRVAMCGGCCVSDGKEPNQYSETQRGQRGRATESRGGRASRYRASHEQHAPTGRRPHDLRLALRPARRRQGNIARMVRSIQICRRDRRLIATCGAEIASVAMALLGFKPGVLGRRPQSRQT